MAIFWIGYSESVIATKTQKKRLFYKKPLHFEKFWVLERQNEAFVNFQNRPHFPHLQIHKITTFIKKCRR